MTAPMNARQTSSRRDEADPFLSGLSSGAAPGRRAIIDIGSNSVRLVVYAGPARTPFLLFNEKVAAGLGASLSATGAIDDAAMNRGIEAVARFACLAGAMDVAELRCIATAAVREASNGALFVRRAREEAGLEIEVFSGDDEARGAGFGVISSIPDADGIVADLGGGSLELARVRGRAVHETVSLPVGVLRLAAIRARGKGALAKFVADALRAAGWDEVERGLPIYLVGGSWRALAHLDMQLRQFPLPIIHQYHIPAERAPYLVRVTAQMGKTQLRKVPAISSSRAATLGQAAALLSVLVRQLDASDLVVSAYGLREGVLYERLNAEERALDPLLVGAAAEGGAQGRFAGHGALIDAWISGLFAQDPPEWARLRRAAALLGDVGWRANPDFRAERGLEVALHGNWVNIDGEGRAMLAQALYSNFGGGTAYAPGLLKLAASDRLHRAVQWGLAIRLAQRLSGGVGGPLEKTRLERQPEGLVLRFLPGWERLRGEAVGRRFRALAQAMDLPWRIDPASPQS